MSVAAGATPAEGRSLWLFGPVPDLLLGCGLGYVLLTPALLLYASTTGTYHWPLAFFAAATALVSAPHYGATVMRVYSNAGDRARYRFFAVHVTLALLLLMAGASRSVWLGSLLITAYVTWSPWHFSGQNYGLALMFLRRRGVVVEPGAKRLFYVSFVTSAMLAMLAIHARGGDFSLSLASVSAPGVPELFSLGIPEGVATGLFVLVGGVYALSTGAAVWQLREGRGLVDLVPALVLIATQALWFAVPSLVADATPSLAFASVWVSAAHGVQYLWINAYYTRRGTGSAGTGAFLGKTLLAGSAVTVLPGLLFAPDLLGSRPWDAGLAMTAFSIINLHHFILDGAIWKLRDGRIANVLLRSKPAAAALPPASGRTRWIGRAVWAGAALCLLIPAVSNWVTFFGIPRSDTREQVERAVDALRWVGRDTATVRFDLGQRFYEAGFLDAAEGQLRRSIELFPMARTYIILGQLQSRRRDYEAALASFEKALELRPDIVNTHVRRAHALLALDTSESPFSSNRLEAGVSLARAIELEPGHPRASVMLSRLQERSDNILLAKSTIESAIRAATDPQTRRVLERRLGELEQAEPRTRTDDW